jgi:transcriptional regulator with XRE-family HTH domain
MGRQMSAARFRLQHEEISAEPFHYKMCGLDDVYLLNGFKVHDTKYGSGVAIDNADGLHRAIGLYLIRNRKVLGPKDVRFLRKNMNYTQEDLASELGVTSQTVARYEKGSTEIPTPVDRLLRLQYVLHLLPEDARLEVMSEVTSFFKESTRIDETGDEPVYFGTTPRGWDKARSTLPHEMCESCL